MQTLTTIEAEINEETPRKSIFDVQVACWKNAMGTKPENRRLRDVLNDIISDKYRQQVQGLRKLLTEYGNPIPYDEEKKHLPAFSISGSARTRKAMIQHSGLIQIDLDDLGGTLEATREKLMYDEHVAFLFYSPSGNGLKAGFRIPADHGAHRENFAAVSLYFQNTYGIEIDPKVKDELRLCFFSWDSTAYLNEDAEEFRAKCKAEPPYSSERLGNCNTEILGDWETRDTRTQDHTLGHTASATHVIDPSRALKAMQMRAQLEKDFPDEFMLYRRLVERLHEAAPSHRNEVVTKAVPMLYRSVGVEKVRLFMHWFYLVNNHLFNDSHETHMQETNTMIEAVAETYLSTLPARELEFYKLLQPREQDAFRICRDLAMYPKEGKEPKEFFLSRADLAARGHGHKEVANRSIRELIQYGILTQIKQGMKRSLGFPGQAASYRWNL